MVCYFCRKNIKEIDYKDTKLLWQFISGLYKIRKREKTDLCLHHQKKVARMVKRARQMGLLPYTRSKR